MSIRDNLNDIISAPAAGRGLDIVIVSTTSDDQSDYWQRRLDLGRGTVCRSDAMVLALTEDWSGGAGNGLGTLYAVAKAADKARRLHGRDLLAELDGGAAVGVYHTAGKGTRLAPLPGSEGNNKPAVKLPSVVELDGRREPLTILEAVIRQTAVYAPGRKGRVGVFWGDQVFIPSCPPPAASTHHVDILASLGPMPDAATWSEQGLERYGLIAVGADGDAAQVEKVSHATAAGLVDDGVISVAGGIGVSLGSFSMSAAMTAALLEEFGPELAARSGKMDTDPHFWMPLTLDRATYGAMMLAKGMEADAVEAHYARMKAFSDRFDGRHPDSRIFGCVDVGADSMWWDYGTVGGYVGNNLKLLGDDEEADCMRTFFGLGSEPTDGSILVDCEITDAKVRGSVLVGVRADRVETEGSIMVNVAGPEVKGDGLLLYNVASEEPLNLDEGTIRADAFHPDRGHLVLWCDKSRDGKDDWHVRLPGNDLSWDELHALNAGTDRDEAARLMAEAFRRARERS